MPFLLFLHIEYKIGVVLLLLCSACCYYPYIHPPRSPFDPNPPSIYPSIHLSNIQYIQPNHHPSSPVWSYSSSSHRLFFSFIVYIYRRWRYFIILLVSSQFIISTQNTLFFLYIIILRLTLANRKF